MGRDNVIPKKIFGYIHPRWRTPVYNIIFVGIISLFAIFIDLETAASLINFGALIAFTFVNLSVISYYIIKKKRYKTIKDFLNYLVMPILGAATVAVLWFNLNIHSLILGLCWAAIGIGYLLYVTNMFRSAPPQMHFEEAQEI